MGAAAYGLWRYRQVAIPAPSAASSGRAGRGGAGGIAPVVAVEAGSGSVPVYLRGLGTVSPNFTVTLHPLDSGEITDIYFQEGQFVKKGDLLMQIDPRPYEATLANAQGQLAHDTALYTDDELDYQRYQALFQQGIIPKQQVDSQQALVNEYKGAMASDAAAIKTAQLNLVYSRITAPIDGRIGLRLVDPGNVIQAGQNTSLAVITQVQPIAVLFNLPQEELAEVYPRLRAGEHAPVVAFDSSNTKQLAVGRLETIDDTIDPSTGTFRCKAMFDNADNALFPDQFVNIRMDVGNEGGLTIVPPSAIQRGPNGSYVFLVGDGNTVHVQPVTEKISEGNQVGLSSGLSAGNEVVVDGADKLQDGTRVTVHLQKMQAPLSAEQMGDAPSAAASAAPASTSPSTPSPDPSTATKTAGTRANAASAGGHKRNRQHGDQPPKPIVH